jgi:hypothetical protein
MKQMFLLVAISTMLSLAFGSEVTITRLKDLEACVLGTPHRSQTGETVIRMCIDGKRHMISNISTNYGYEELIVERLYKESEYGDCKCSFNNGRLEIKQQYSAVKKPTKKYKLMPLRDIGYSNVRGNKIVYLDANVSIKR